jgi:hypothetical protein
MIRLDNSYTPYRDDTDPAYPGGKAIPAPSGDSFAGTPWRARFFNQINGFFQAAIMKARGVFTVSNEPDNASVSEVLNSLEQCWQSDIDNSLDQAKDYTNEKVADVVNSSYGEAYWFGKTVSETVPALPINVSQSYFDFTSNTPYYAKSDLSGWDSGNVIVPQNGMVIGISSAFWDLVVDLGHPGKAIYSSGKNGWDYFPDSYNIPDNVTIEKRASDGALSVIFKSIRIPGEPIPVFINKSCFPNEAAFEEYLAQYRLIPSDGRTISITDPKAERLLQYCLIPHSVAMNNTSIMGLYRTDNNWANHEAAVAAAASFNLTRAMPVENGAFLAIPDANGLFLRGSGSNAFRKMANDAPYDGKGIGEYLGDAIRNISGIIPRIGYYDLASSTGLIRKYIRGGDGGLYTAGSGYGDLLFDASQIVPTALENRSASISANICIAY